MQENTFKNITPVETIYPEQNLTEIYQTHYALWQEKLAVLLANN